MSECASAPWLMHEWLDYVEGDIKRVTELLRDRQIVTYREEVATVLRDAQIMLTILRKEVGDA